MFDDLCSPIPVQYEHYQYVFVRLCVYDGGLFSRTILVCIRACMFSVKGWLWVLIKGCMCQGLTLSPNQRFAFVKGPNQRFACATAQLSSLLPEYLDHAADSRRT